MKNSRRGKPEKGILGEIGKLYDFMQSHSLETLEYSHGSMSVRLVRGRSLSCAPAAPAGAPGVAAAVPRPAAAPAAGPGQATIKSPMTGIFYRAMSPSSPPFVREGASVPSGQVVCLIEAMKVFNEVRTETDCVITKVLAENGTPVKTGQDLFVMENKTG